MRGYRLKKVGWFFGARTSCGYMGDIYLYLMSDRYILNMLEYPSILRILWV